jgi:hypothetical protein
MFDRIKALRREPRFGLSRINRTLTDINSAFHQKFVAKSGTNMMAEDWDSLLILDACRYDDFVSVSHLSGTTRPRQSLASTSAEWYEENIGEREWFETVCVTANPHSEPFADRFHSFEQLYSERYWDRELRTVPPSVVAAKTRETMSEYPNKRLLVHFMQPHLPPIGPMRNELPASGNPPEGVVHDHSHIGIQTYLRGRVGGVTEKRVHDAYRENLAIVHEIITGLVDDLDGKTVITSDHGELFGERLYPIPVRGILHKRGIRLDPLVTVPWHECPYSSRRTTSSEAPDEDVRTLDAETVESRLESLGYR